MSSLRGASDASVITIFSVALPVLAMGSIGTFEIAEVLNTKSKLQTIVDTAALNGAGELGVDLSTTTADRAQAFADRLADPLRLRWSVTSSATLDTAARSVTVHQDAHRGSFFGSLLPPGGWNLSATATGIRTAGTPLCVLGIQSGGSQVVSLSGSGVLSAAGCLVQSNGDLVAASGTSVSAGAARTVGAASGSISPAPVTQAPSIADPFAAMSIAVPTQCDVALTSSTVYLNPGTHCGDISLAGNSNIVLMPGEHYFVGSSIKMAGNSQISGTDVVMILKGFTSIAFHGNASVTLEGRKSGSYAGFVFVTDRSLTGVVDLSATNVRKLHGTVYVPSATLAVSGKGNKVSDQSPWTVVVAKQIQVDGSATLYINSNYAGASVPVPQGVGPSTASGGIRLSQ
ncbi:TadE/TadG family type IV pilus assembly protein [Methylobacterium sp. JK268]